MFRLARFFYIFVILLMILLFFFFLVYYSGANFLQLVFFGLPFFLILTDFWDIPYDSQETFHDYFEQHLFDEDEDIVEAHDEESVYDSFLPASSAAKEYEDCDVDVVWWFDNNVDYCSDFKLPSFFDIAYFLENEDSFVDELDVNEHDFNLYTPFPDLELDCFLLLLLMCFWGSLENDSFEPKDLG